MCCALQEERAQGQAAQLAEQVGTLQCELADALLQLTTTRWQLQAQRTSRDSAPKRDKKKQQQAGNKPSLHAMIDALETVRLIWYGHPMTQALAAA